MATLYGVNAAAIASNPPQQSGVGEDGGRVRLLYDKYTLVEDIASDVIYLGAKIPKGARVIDAMVKFGDLGTAGTIDVGWAASADGLELGDADGFMDDVDVNAAANVVWSSDNLANAPGIGKKFAAECQPIITATGTTATGSVSIELFIEYVID